MNATHAPKVSHSVPIAVLVLTLVSAGAVLSAQADAAKIQLPASSFSAERSDIKTLSIALGRFLAKADPLEGKASVAKGDLDAVLANADDVKRAVPAFQRAVSSAIAKLQANGRWTADLDSFVEAQLRARGATNTLNFVRLNGGVRAALQSSVSTIANVGSSLDADVRRIRGQGLAARALAELIGTPVDASLRSWVSLCASRYADGVLCIVSSSACLRAQEEDAEGACVIR